MGDCKCLKERGIAYECDNLRAENQELRAKLEKAREAILESQRAFVNAAAIMIMLRDAIEKAGQDTKSIDNFIGLCDESLNAARDTLSQIGEEARDD